MLRIYAEALDRLCVRLNMYLVLRSKFGKKYSANPHVSSRMPVITVIDYV